MIRFSQSWQSRGLTRWPIADGSARGQVNTFAYRPKRSGSGLFVTAEKKHCTPGATIRPKPLNYIAVVGSNLARIVLVFIRRIAWDFMTWATTFTSGAWIGTIQTIIAGRPIAIR